MDTSANRALLLHFRVQIWTGVIFIGGYATYYTQLAGYSASMSFKLLIVLTVIQMAGNMMSWYLIDRVGRRILTVYGNFALCVLLFVMGGLAVGGSRNEIKATVGIILVYAWLNSFTIGATSYTYLTETATSRLRVKTVSIGLAVQSLFGLMWSFVLPYLFNPDKLNLGGKLGFVFGAMGIPCVVFMWWYQPETAGRSYEELDEMFIKSVPARDFKQFKIQTKPAKQHQVFRRDSSPDRQEA